MADSDFVHSAVRPARFKALLTTRVIGRVDWAIARLGLKHGSTKLGACSAISTMPVNLLLRGERRASQIPGNLLYEHALLFDPRSPCLPSHPAGLCSLPVLEDCRRLLLPQLRGSITRPTHSLCTLRSSGYPTPRNTRFRLVASLVRVGDVNIGTDSCASAMCPSDDSNDWPPLPSHGSRRVGSPLSSVP